MALTQDQVDEFKAQEQELKTDDDISEKCVSYCDLADDIRDAGDLDQAKRLYIEALKYVEFGVEWWDDFGFRLVDTNLLGPNDLKDLFDKWEINVKENRGNNGFVEKEQLYGDLVTYLEKHDEERVARIKLEQSKSYTLQNLEGPFGTSRAGDGKIVYLFAKELDSTAVNLVVSTAYHTFTEDEDGNIVRNWTEYDPSQLDTEAIGIVHDLVTFSEITDKIDNENSDVGKFELFLKQEILQKNIPLIFIDHENKVITQISEEDLNTAIEKYKKELSIFVREYDELGDY